MDNSQNAKQQEDWKLVFDAILDPVMILDTNQRILNLNRAAVKASGSAENQLLGQYCYQIFHAGNCPAQGCPLEKLLKSNRPEVMEMEMAARDETYLVSVSPIFDENNQLVRIIHIAKKITDRSIIKERRFAESIKESENRFRAIFENAMDGILLADINSKKFHEGNKRISELLGFSLEELKNLKVDDIHPPEHLPYVLEQFGKQLRGEIKVAKEIPVRRKNGTIFYADIASSPVIIAGKAYLIGIFRDITEKKISREAIKYAVKRAEEEKNKTEAIIAALGDAISIQDTSFSVLYQNEVHKKIIGDQTGKFCYEAYENKSEICEECPVARSFIDGAVHAAERKVQINGETKYFEIAASPLKDADGKIIAGIEVARDITIRRKAENATKESEERFKLVSQLTSDYAYGIRVGKENDLNFEWVTGALSRITGYKSEEIQDLGGWGKIIHQKDNPIHLNKLKKLLAGKESAVEYRIMDKSGELRWMRDYARPLWDEMEGRVTYIYGAVQDITEQKKLSEENLRSRDQIIEEMKKHEEYVLDVADRLRNPLQIIMGYLELFEANGLSSNQVEMLGKIKNSAWDLEKGIKKLT